MDIWSFGCLILELLTLQVPYSGLPDSNIHDLLQVSFSLVYICCFTCIHCVSCMNDYYNCQEGDAIINWNNKNVPFPVEFKT